MSATEMQEQRTPLRGAGRKRRRPLALVIALIAIIVVAAWIVPWASSTETLDFPDAAVTRVDIETTGSVSVSAGEQTAVTFHNEWSLAGRPATRSSVDGGVLRVVGECRAFLVRLGRCQADVAATVPASAEVVVRTSAGGVDVQQIDGGVDLRSSAGSIAVREVAGPARLRSSAGGIRGELTGGDVDASTSAGGVTLTLTGPFERLSATSSAGGIDLTVPDEVYRVDARTSAGGTDVQVRTDPDETREIHARSSAGSIFIRRGSE